MRRKYRHPAVSRYCAPVVDIDGNSRAFRFCAGPAGNIARQSFFGAGHVRKGRATRASVAPPKNLHSACIMSMGGYTGRPNWALKGLDERSRGNGLELKTKKASVARLRRASTFRPGDVERPRLSQGIGGAAQVCRSIAHDAPRALAAVAH